MRREKHQRLPVPSPSRSVLSEACLFIRALTPEPHSIWHGPGFTSLSFRPGQNGRRSSQNPQQHPKDWSQSPRQPRSSGSGSSWQRRTAESTSPRADTGHWLVQLTQRGGYISWPCFPLSPTHRDRGMDKMAWEDDWADRQARRRKRRGWVVVSSWSGLLRFHLTRRCG